MLQTEQDILNEIQNDKEMMAILKTAKTMNLPDWWICAGFVRSKVWDVLHDFSVATPIDDVDLVYFDPSSIDESTEKNYEQKLTEIMPGVPWSVKNEARMHLLNNFEPFSSTVDAISKFPETPTALGVKIDEGGELLLTAQHGVDDVLKMVVRPTAYFSGSEERMSIYRERIQKKNWHEKWGKITYLKD